MEKITKRKWNEREKEELQDLKPLLLYVTVSQ